MWNKFKTFVAATWAKIKSACFGSITMAWSYLLSLGGTFLSNVDSLAVVLGDPNLNQQIASVVGDAKLLGKWLLTVGIITAAARLKSLVLAKKD